VVLLFFVPGRAHPLAAHMFLDLSGCFIDACRTRLSSRVPGPSRAFRLMKVAGPSGTRRRQCCPPRIILILKGNR
jgi:hypothetical protein